MARPRLHNEFGASAIASGSKLLDLALGGGWAQDKIINIVGVSGSGKTLLAIEMSANFIRQHPAGKVAYRETESAFLPSYAASVGMPLGRVDFGHPLGTVEALFRELEQLVE